LSQRKHALDLIEETGLLGCKSVSTPMEVNVNLWCDSSHLLDDTGQCRRLIRTLIYLTIIRSDIIFKVGVLSRFMYREVNWTVALRILAYVKNFPEKGLLYKKHGHVHICCYSDSGYAGDEGDKKSTTSCYTIVGRNLVTLRGKK